jgi:hypothetical protein
MAFESLSSRFSFEIDGFPHRWLPLIHLYDPDLLMFPIYYFHILDPAASGRRPLETERVFGYVEHIALTGSSSIRVSIVTNKDLSNQINAMFLPLVIAEVKERFGCANPITRNDVENAFNSPLDYANPVLREMWQRSISNAYGNILPFGRLWDEVLGFPRFVASWNSQSGRKGELIQTHLFASKFGVPIQSSGDVPQVDFFLLPSINELTDNTNPLTVFPNFRKLIDIARLFQQHYCSLIEVAGFTLSRFKNPFGGIFDTKKLLKIINSTNIPQEYRPLATECFNAFGKGPARSVIALMLLDDLRQGRISPSTLNSYQCGSIYDSLGGTYQSPKVIQIYAQQSFGNSNAMPIDTWIETFFKWPLRVFSLKRKRMKYVDIFSHASNLGRVERLLWVVGQARKVHSSVCNDALWCLKYGSSKKPRGANPFSCNICLLAIRQCCPAHEMIKSKTVGFNLTGRPQTDFLIKTSSGNNTTPNQKFVSCRGKSIYDIILDDFSPSDDPDGFAPFPDPNHKGSVITVEEFVRIY